MPVTNLMQKNMMWTIQILVLSCLVGIIITMAQPECGVDANCMSNQYCYNRLCTEYINCSRYNRAEARTPAHEPRQCGDCLKGYPELVKSTDSCVNVNSSPPSYVIYGIIILGVVFVVVFVIHVMIWRWK